MIIGIDPGASGGLACMPGRAFVEPVISRKMPATVTDLIILLRGWIHAYHPGEGERATVWIEKAQSMPAGGERCRLCKRRPAQGVASSFKFGMNFGVLIGVVATLGLRYEIIIPAVWMRSLRIPPRGKDTKTVWKNRLKGHAQSLFPGHKIILATADAILIAEACKRKGNAE